MNARKTRNGKERKGKGRKGKERKEKEKEKSYNNKELPKKIIISDNKCSDYRNYPGHSSDCN